MRYAVFFFALPVFFGAMPEAWAATEPATPTVSRCLTPEVKKLHIQMTQRFEKTTSFVDENSSADIKEAFQAYKNGMDIAWAAIEDPYCGYGNNYSGVPSRLYLKTVNRIHERFVQGIKQIEDIERDAKKKAVEQDGNEKKIVTPIVLIYLKQRMFLDRPAPLLEHLLKQ